MVDISLWKGNLVKKFASYGMMVFILQIHILIRRPIMIINRMNLTKLTEIFKKVEDVKFNINTQYKLLKMKKSIEEEE